MNICVPLQLNESDLIDACVKQEDWAQKHIYERYYGYLLSVCLRYASTREEAKDWLHDGFIKVFLNINQYKRGTSLKSWLYRIVMNSCIDNIRKASRIKRDPDNHFPTDEPIDLSIIQSMDIEHIIKAVQQLSDTYRVVFNMFVIEGYSHREIAETLQISEATSRSNLVKARNQLKKLLSKSYPNEF
jgi:RNA polymerase sigma factor (sigma-70 family)